MAQTKSQKRQVSPLSLAFLDVMFCGFGAVILLFLILDHADTVAAVTVDPSIASEVSLLEEEVLEGALNLERIRNTVADVSLEVGTAEGLAREIQEQLQTFLQELAATRKRISWATQPLRPKEPCTRTLESFRRFRLHSWPPGLLSLRHLCHLCHLWTMCAAAGPSPPTALMCATSRPLAAARAGAGLGAHASACLAGRGPTARPP